MARDDRFPDEVGVDRRMFIKAGLGLAAVGLTGALVASGKSILPPPIVQEGEVNEGFVYAKGDTPNPFGFDALAGQEASVEHFTKPFMGVSTLWRALFDPDGRQLPGTGFPALLIRVDATEFSHPAEWTNGDFISDVGIVALWDRCVHLCCFPQWHLAKLPPAYQDYEASRVPRTFDFGQDPIWCRCHNSQYDPMTFVWDVHPSGTMYIGANLAHGPATRSLAAISIAEQGGRIAGSKFTALPPPPSDAVAATLKGRAASPHEAKTYREWYFAYCR